jgi:23S rRNA pseudouridine2605 synthase
MVRLNKYIASAGIASRRKADLLIENGNVKINGLAVTEMGYIVRDGDVVDVNGRIITPDKRKVYIMLNKPKGFITTAKDEEHRPTVMDLISDISERIFPVGRLYANTTGLLIMTNDGDFAQALSHPGNKIYKTYRAKVMGTISDVRLRKLRHGVDIGGFTTSPAIVKLIKQSKTSAIVEIKIYEGKNRQVRKMFAAVGNKVMELERTAIGDLYMGKLMEGHYRKLSVTEISYFKK